MQTTTPAITRSSGVFVGGYNPGGGRTGLTPELDAMVVEAAERLRARFGRDVQIRFNSDRLGGGAFLEQGPTLGVSIQASHLPTLKASCARYDFETFDELCARMRLDPDGPDIQIGLAAMVDGTLLTDPALADQGVEGRRYAWVRADDVDGAIAAIDVLVGA